MIKFWYFVIQNLDKACYINFLIATLDPPLGGLPTVFANIKQTQDSGRKRLQLVNWFQMMPVKYSSIMQWQTSFCLGLRWNWCLAVNLTLCVLYIHDIDTSSLSAPPSHPPTYHLKLYSVRWATHSKTKMKLFVGFHILFIVYLQSAPFTMLEPLTCHVGAMYNKSIFSCICQVMKTPQWYVYAAIEILNSERN